MNPLELPKGFASHRVGILRHVKKKDLTVRLRRRLISTVTPWNLDNTPHLTPSPLSRFKTFVLEITHAEGTLFKAKQVPTLFFATQPRVLVRASNGCVPLAYTYHDSCKKATRQSLWPILDLAIVAACPVRLKDSLLSAFTGHGDCLIC
ncbi:RBR-type E3 ubiquitin transferase [Fusarium oxysporum f. sp. albedinis]|nr:RBR-type E3 ubiquitin transferase [Fusarium oxysporum f. sp. albedinis]